MFDAIVLAGGSARRLDGADKPALEIDGVSLLDRVLTATNGAERTVVVGPTRATAAAVEWRRENPSGGGPVAAIAAGAEVVDAAWCLILAADLPWIAPAVPVLLTTATGHDAAVLLSGTRRNYLAAVWRTDALRAALGRVAEAVGSLAGVAARALYEGVDVAQVTDENDWGRDCDTWADLERARERGHG